MGCTVNKDRAAGMQADHRAPRARINVASLLQCFDSLDWGEGIYEVERPTRQAGDLPSPESANASGMRTVGPAVGAMLDMDCASVSSGDSIPFLRPCEWSISKGRVTQRHDFA